MKRDYMKPELRVVLLQHRTTLLSGSVIGPGGDNEPPAAPLFEGEDWDDWESVPVKWGNGFRKGAF